MKKLFFFKSSSPSSENKEVPPPTDKQVYWEKPLEHKSNGKAGDRHVDSLYNHGSFFSKSGKQSSSQSSRASSRLRRSRSFSSAGSFGSQLEQTDFSCSNDHDRSLSSTSCGAHHYSGQSFSSRALTPERRQREYKYKIAPTNNPHKFERPGSDISSGNSSSSNASNKVVDRYIDGEHQQRGEIKKKSNLSQRHALNGAWSGTRPPRVQILEPTSPTISGNGKQRTSFLEAEATRRLAKNVIERLSQSRPLPRDHDHGMPITIEDIYGGSLDKCPDFDADVYAEKSQLDETSERICEHRQVHSYSGIKDDSNDFEYVENKDIDVKLLRRAEQAEERIMLLSEELEQEAFLQDGQYNFDALMQRIRNLAEDKMSLALEISGLLKSQINERSSAKKELGLAKSELELQTLRLEKEKKELQAALEKELDRRSSDWSSKLEKYQLEEHRLRERVRELAEHNVSLQREVSSLHEKEKENRDMITHSEQQMTEVTSQNEELTQENFILRQKYSELQEKFRAAGEDRDCIRSNFERKDNECKELHKSVSRLLRTCSEQEKTIDGLREEFSEGLGKDCSQESFDKHVKKLQIEQIRLTGVELALRRELESHRLEVDSLRHENISVLNRLKSNGQDDDALTFKLDKEMWSRLCCLQNQGLSMINEGTQLCSKLLGLVKEKESKLSENKQGIEYTKSSLNEQFIIESEMKVQSLNRGMESLTRSLQTMSTLLHEKSSLLPSQSQVKDEGSCKSSEDIIRSELKAENLLTSLLREKIYSKELEVEQLQAELATAVRGNDILRCEVQNTMDSLSCVTHKLKDLELQMLKKDEDINNLQDKLQECSKELTIIKGILPTVSQERDVMWEEVQKYSEKNMLLNSELIILKKKIEALDEDILIKEGQITILKDAVEKNSFDLLDTHDSTREFLLN